jgi:type II secretory pathway pseudopilin PulG
MRRTVPAFTLVELLVVIAILVLLAGLVVPGVHGVVRWTQLTTTHARMRSIALGLRAYEVTFGRFPPSDPAAVERETGSNQYAVTGSEALALYAQSWYKADDGSIERGRGYRVPRLEGGFQSFGPVYTGSPDGEVFASRDPQYGFDGAPEGVFFAGALPEHRPIIYFKARPRGDDGYPLVQAHNDRIIRKWLAPPDAGRISFQELTCKHDVVVGGTEFLLIHPGGDGVYLSGDDILVP